MKDWISQDLAKYGGNVSTDLVHIPPEIHWGVEFDVSCDFFDNTTNMLINHKEDRVMMHSIAKVADAKDWTREQLNEWL